MIGGGKIGTDFLRYARKNEFPFVLIIDRDENAPASRETKVLKTENELVNLLRNKSLSAFSKDKPGLFRVEDENKLKNKGKNERENKEENSESEAYFYKMDMNSIPSLFTLGIPEYIIPAVPCHAVAYMLANFLKSFNKELSTNEAQEEKSPVKELFIRPEDFQLRSFFEVIVAAFPEDVIAGLYPEYGMLFFSYAREGEICPDGCPGPRDHCPTFGRKKPETITEYTRELVHVIPGWVFESHQMKPGIGGLKGEELKQNLLEIAEFVKKVQENNSVDTDSARGRTEDDGNKDEKIKERAFFIATTCTCHGVLNLFMLHDR
ncbi:MAG: hypothetical protein QG610_1978 [Euryarchaeota archaeon]|nr:hypothetical protein [Euryarchaeota archaeon]